MIPVSPVPAEPATGDAWPSSHLRAKLPHASENQPSQHEKPPCQTLSPRRTRASAGRTPEDFAGIPRYTDYDHDRASRLTRQTGYTDGTSGAQATDYAYNKAGTLAIRCVRMARTSLGDTGCIRRDCIGSLALLS